jgi:hypothetical protein
VKDWPVKGSFVAGKLVKKKASLMNPGKGACSSSTHKVGALEKFHCGFPVLAQ